MEYLKNVSTLRHHEQKCTGCGMCLTVCPHSVFEDNGDKVRIAAPDRCMECGACVMNCPFDALEVHAGVGCAAAILTAMLRGGEPTCGCSDQ